MAMRYYAPFPGGGGESLRPRGPHALRIGDAERDAAAADLGEHYAAGRLTLDELHERLDAVFSAKTFSHLTRIMADLPGPGRLPWHAKPGGPGGVGMAPGFRPRTGCRPTDFAYYETLGTADRPWRAARSPMAGFQFQGPEAPSTPVDRAGRFAALSLLLLAMLIWLFTALLFARHGLYHPGGPIYPQGPPVGH
jgi:hypothetical protein